ncbi:hypothetical protein [Barrientosiimonas endolithica]|uniref:Uncharacterized protein n=1 Tax=Barrientosiimonas endolithica TaxID=1535208 RepID=A0ABN6YIP8_9MICO|nr:hypothetical protein [Barrientosiimonas endolithica]BDZ57379.1 hypothetical protein GCM10025872_10360 [Barrientosiimonas endolithica]
MAAQALAQAAHEPYVRARGEIEEGISDGSLLRGEVLARWQEFVGTGEWFRQLDEGVSRVRDKIASVLRGRGRAAPVEDLGEALHTGVAALIASHGESAAMGAARNWRSLPGGSELLADDRSLAQVSPQFDERVQRLVREWQGDVLEMVRSEAGGGGPPRGCWRSASTASA